MELPHRSPSRLAGLLLCVFALPSLAAVPTLGSIGVLPGGNEDQTSPITLTHATLLGASNAADSDSTPVSFRVKTLLSGTLRDGGPVTVGSVLDPGGSWTWRPKPDDFGTISAFEVVAVSGGQDSMTNVAVRFDVASVNDMPSFNASDFALNEDSGPYTKTGWANNISTGPANESGQTVTFEVVYNSKPELFSSPVVVSNNGTITFTAAPNENGDAEIRVKIIDNGGTDRGGVNESSEQTYVITIDEMEDAPVLSGTFQGTATSPLTDEGAVPGSELASPQEVFGLLTIIDVDHLKPDPEEIDVIVTVPTATDEFGTFSLPGADITSTGAGTVFTLADRSPLDAQSELRAARFTPFANVMPVGIDSFNLTVEVRDGTVPTPLQATPISGPVYLESVNDIPTLTASPLLLSPSTIPDSGQINPFRLTVSDPDVGETFTVTLVETSTSTANTQAPFGTLVPSPFSVTGDAAAVGQAVADLSYRPNLLSDDVSATFRLEVIQIHPGGAVEPPVGEDLGIDIAFTSDPPEISGITVALQRTTDDPTDSQVLPFSTVTISDPDPGQELVASLTLDDPVKGSFIFLTSGAPVGSITGTAGQITALLRDVVFVPAQGLIEVNQSDTITIRLTVSDTSANPSARSNDQTQIEVTAVDGAPKVKWLLDPANRFPTSDTPGMVDPSDPRPFTPVAFEDDGDLTITINIDDPDKGDIKIPGGNGFTETSADSNIYTFTGSPAAVTTAIQALEFNVNPTFIFPPDQPGRTDLTITATDSALNRTVRLLPIILISDQRSFLVTQLIDDESVAGSLRNAIAAASDDDVIVFALPSYPATIRLTQGPLLINKHLSFRGPGSDKLTISGDSNANMLSDAADTQLFQITTRVRMSGLKLSRGFAAEGGAITVKRHQPGLRPGELIIEDCTISNCVAGQWGGAIDIYEGSITAERCLFEGNSLNASSGQGGGAVSLYTEQACRFVNCTFSGNAQSAPTGFGGGGIYAENFTPSRPFDITVTHCTFTGNIDQSNRGSSIHANVSNTRIHLTNNIFADFSARNLAVSGSGEILTKGGNLSNDNTTTTRIQGGVPQQATLLNHATDHCNTDPLLAPLAPVEGGVKAHRLLAGSPAAGGALPQKAALDQRGVVRNSSPDCGALDGDALGRLVIHEIRRGPTAFIECYNPRDQASLSLNGFELLINGVLRHTFGPGDIINPGSGLVVADGAVTTLDGSIPVIVASLPLNERGLIEVRRPSGIPSTQAQAPSESTLVASVSYVTSFARAFSDPSIMPAVTLGYGDDSITLAPQLAGSAFAPHRLVQAPPLVIDTSIAAAPTPSPNPASPGGYAISTPFGSPNDFPVAIPDRIEITEDELAFLDVLQNDLDPDGADELFIVDLNPTPIVPVPATGKATIASLNGAAVSIAPATLPLRGTRVSYDPRIAFQQLPEGARFVDTFAYSVLDFGGGAIMSFADGGGGTTVIGAPTHRLNTGDIINVRGVEPIDYNGTFTVTKIDADTLRIPVDFPSVATVPSATTRGRWSSASERTPTVRSQASVEVSVLGRNDAPTPLGDTVAINEESVLRIFADPNFASVGTALDTDSLFPSRPQAAAIGLLANDSDPDITDNPFTKLRIIGVTQASEITDYNGGPGDDLITVTAPNHGLDLDASVTLLISGYGGHPSYNGYHEATITSSQTFTIPVDFIDNDSTKGLWTILNNDNRLNTTSRLDAAVNLEIRADRTLANVVYDPRQSNALDSLAQGETAEDSFYYAVEDTLGAVSLALVTVNVAGLNDLPIPTPNPPGLVAMDPLLSGGATRAGVLNSSAVLYTLPTFGQTDRVDAALRPAGADAGVVIAIPALNRTDEDTVLALSSAEILADDVDIDASNVLSLRIQAGQNSSFNQAAITISPDGSTVFYDPTTAAPLQGLAFREQRIDTFEITVFDGFAGVTTLVAVVVDGRNDTPIASDAAFATPEKTLLSIPSPGLLMSAQDVDQDIRLPDNRKFLLPIVDAPTTVFGTKLNISLDRKDGAINSIAAHPGTPAVTRITTTPHGLESGEEVVLLDSGPLTGQYVMTRINETSFTIPVAYEASFAGFAGGNWSVLSSNLDYDARASVFTDDGGGPNFTLQGLADGQTYVDTFTYTILDGSFLFANDDFFRVEADRTLIRLDVLANDCSLEGIATERKIVSVGLPNAGGSLEINDDSSLIYTPQTGFVGDESFPYTIEDNLGNRATALATARVTIDRLNGNLRAGDDRFTVATGQSPLLEVLANDNIIPATGDPLELVAFTPLAGFTGNLKIEGAAIRYEPDPAATSFPYSESFSYSISGGGSARATATVEVLVVDRRNTLNVRDDMFSVPSGSVGAILNVLENDNILPGTGAALTITSVTGPATIVDGPALSFTSDPSFLGAVALTYTVSDGVGGTAMANVTVNVGYLTTNNDIFSVPFDDPGLTTDDGETELDVLANDNVIQSSGGIVTISDVSPATTALGTMTMRNDGRALLFDPVAGATGQMDFVYTVTDTTGRTTTGSVTVVVIGDGIRASSDFYSVQTDAVETALPVISNDLRISPLPGALSVTAIGTGPNAPDQGGTATIGPDFKTIIYSAVAGFEGVESFTYSVTDGDGSDTARVSIRSTRGETIASDDSFLVFLGSTGNRLEVLANDRVIPDGGQLLAITALGSVPASDGTLTISEDGAALIYTPPSSPLLPFIRNFTYEITSGGTVRAMGSIRIEVIDRGGARDLETNNDSFTVLSDSEGTLLPVLANDAVLPANPDGWTITEITPPVAKDVFPVIAADFPAPFVLAADLADQSGPVNQYLWSRFQASSRNLFTQAATNPESVNAALLLEALISEFDGLIKGVAIYDATRFMDVALGVRTQSILDMGAAGPSLRVLNRLLLEDALAGALRVSAGGALQITDTNLIYVPQPGFVGTEEFSYFVSDGLGGTGSADVSVRVGDVSVSPDFFTLLSGGVPVPLDVTANDGLLRDAFPSTPDPAQADFILSTERPVTIDPVAAGTAVVRAGNVDLLADPSFSGPAVMTYWVVDDSGCEFPGTAFLDIRTPDGDRDRATVSIQVTGENDDPKLLDSAPSSVTDKGTVKPFENATVVEYDDQRNQRVTVTIGFPPGRGILRGGFTEVYPGVFKFVGTAAEATVAIRSLEFTPFMNRVTVGSTEETLFSVDLDDGFASPSIAAQPGATTVTPENDLPLISGTIPLQKLYQYDTIRPFAGINITDVDDLASQPLTISLTISDRTRGILTNTGALIEVGTSGVFVGKGTPASLSAALRAMVFTPTPGDRITPSSPETVEFALSVNDGFGPAVEDNDTSVIILHGEVDHLLPLDLLGQDDSETLSAFGSSVSVSVDTMVVGAPLRNTTGNNAGSAFVYERDAGLGAPWGQVMRLAASDTLPGDNFGAAVAVDGDFMVIGSPLADPGGLSSAGVVHVFHRNPADKNSWIEVAKLQSPLAATGEQFGKALAIQGNTLLVGAPNSARPSAPFSGRAYVFALGAGGPGDWSPTQTLEAAVNLASSANSDGEFFGAAVALDGNTAIIGSPGANKARTPFFSAWNHGAAYIFTRVDTNSGWIESKKLENFANSLQYSGFGFSVDISGDRVIVGVHSVGSPYGWVFEGEARIYERNKRGSDQWDLVQTLSPATGGVSRNYGYSVGVEGELILVGSPSGLEGEMKISGFMDVFSPSPADPDLWVPLDRFSPGPPESEDRFAHAISIDRFTASVGTTSDGDNPSGANLAGGTRVYEFRHNLGPRLTQAVPNQIAYENQPFSFLMDLAVFDDPTYSDELTVSASMADGSPMPATGWLSFDPVSLNFTGTPTSVERRPYHLLLRATNPLGSTVISNTFTITVDPRASGLLEDVYAQWAVTRFPASVLANPMLELGVWGMDASSDGDSTANVFEMLFGTEPDEADPSQMVFKRESETISTLRFPVSDEFPIGSVYVEWSTDLITWSREGVTLTPQTLPGGGIQMLAEIISPTPRHRFLVRISTGPRTPAVGILHGVR